MPPARKQIASNVHIDELRVRGKWPPKGREGSSLAAFIRARDVIGPHDFYVKLHGAIDALPPDMDARERMAHAQKLVAMGRTYASAYKFEVPFSFEVEAAGVQAGTPISADLRRFILTRGVSDRYVLRQRMHEDIANVESAKASLERHASSIDPERLQKMREGLAAQVEGLKRVFTEINSIMPP